MIYPSTTLIIAVYPRVCGGTAYAELAYYGDGGLSPRVRGNPRAAGPAAAGAWSIPACAGEPLPRFFRPDAERVYPRVCGGTLIILSAVGWGVGLSPRVRGNPDEVGLMLDQAGSIPACAGEPFQVSHVKPRCRVYPRVCGGTP